MRAGRETTRSRRRSGSTSPTLPVRRGRRSQRSPSALLDRAEADAETPMPGYTHLQRAQPVTVGHHLLAWVEMLERDLVRFALPPRPPRRRARSAPARSPARLCRCPRLQNQLRNSLDAVADRDFALDYLYAVTVCFVHLSRIGEELVLWTTAEFGFARLGEDAATGSSMMPQKLNPDVAELARGQGRHRDRASDRAAGDGEGAAARLQPRPPGGQGAGLRGARRSRGRAGCADARSCAGSSSTGSGSRPRRAIRSCSPPTPPRGSSARECRSATRTSRSPSRCGTAATRRRRRPTAPAPGPGGVAGRRRRGPRASRIRVTRPPPAA